MDDPARDGPSSTRPRPPEATAAGALAPPPPSSRLLRGFLDAVVLGTCGVAGVLLFFTDVGVGYALLLLGVAVLAAVDLGLVARRSRGDTG